ncbi:MAG TPA: isoprenylcysteine carboxylmethyltransferase family protein [Hyphomicrobiaceae bacterium]|nr:isoprenylcysteine carboxylmethyltransferase family protein [Hyphomicrobiaceae bacterium]
MNKLYRRAALKFLQLPVIVGLLLFLPAGTFDYWEAWLFTAVFFACSLAITIYLAVLDPRLLESRMNAGPGAEKEPAQKVIVFLALLCFAAVPVVSALDHRFGWSHVPPGVVLLGNALIVLSYIGFYFVFRANRFGSATIQIAEGQNVASTGPYRFVRHPMYSFALIMTVGMPLALGSGWGLAMLVPTLAVIIARLLDEERFLAKSLPGYASYMKEVPHRLVPFVW